MSADDLLGLVAEREGILDALADGPLTPGDAVERLDVSGPTFSRAVRGLAEAGFADRGDEGCVLTPTGRLALDRYRACRRDIEDAVAAEGANAPRSADDLLGLAVEREGVIEALADGPLTPGDAVERLDVSGPTFSRAVRSLAEAGLADRDDEGCVLTPTGRLVLDRYRACRRDVEGVVAAERALAPLDPDAPVDAAALVDAEIHLGDGPTPYGPEERLREVVRSADRFRAALPVLDDPGHLRLLYEHVVTDDRPAELLVGRTLADSLFDRFRSRVAAMVGTDGFVLRTGEVPPFGLVLATDDDYASVALVVFGDHGVHAVVVTHTERAREWAATLLDECSDRTTPVTDGSGRHTAGDFDPDGSANRPGLPVDLEREGFVRLSRQFFVDRRVADPATAWRAGLDLSEVHTGYAVERAVGTDDGDRSVRGAVTDAETLTGRLTERLLDGEDCALVGPPGSGKSTTCKRVACDWYDADRGPVFYRESGRGGVFESVEALLAGIGSSDGHALVVVEDAVRPDAAAVFEVLERAGDAVSFLLDARESEWRDPPGESVEAAVRADLAVETMPRPSDETVQRLIEHFERTAGVDIDLPAARLRERVRSPPSGDGAEPGELLSLLHHLATHADPLASGPTSLEDDAAAVYESAADADGTALDVALAANLLNAAGVTVADAHLRAAAGPGADGFGTAVDRLEGRVLFGVDADGSYRTVHEAWSVAFLTALLDGEGESAARDRVGEVLSRVLALADDPALRERIGTASGEGFVEGIAADPAEWADATVESLVALARERPKVAALVGDGMGPAFDLPDACVSTTCEAVTARLGTAFLDAGEYDRAETAFERLADGEEFRVRGLRGLAEVARSRGEYDTAEARAERCLSLARETGEDRTVAAVRLTLGDVAGTRSRYDEAREHYEAALSTARAVDAPVIEADCLAGLGFVATQQDDYDRARTHVERALSAYRAVGDRIGEAEALSILGTVAYRQSEYDLARERNETALDIHRSVGDRAGEAAVLTKLGTVAYRRDRHDRAAAYHERSLEIYRAIGDRDGEADSLDNLGAVHEQRGEYDRARECYREALEIHREVGDGRDASTTLNNLGNLALLGGEYDRAREYYRQCLDLQREVDHRREIAIVLNNLGEVAHLQGRHARAREYFEQSLSIRREIGARQGQASSLTNLGAVARDLGEYDRAGERLREARDIAEEVGSPMHEGVALRRLASVARATGDTDRAREQLAEARSLFETAGIEPQTARTRLETARLALSNGDAARAREAAEAARASFEDLGMAHWSARGRLLSGRAAAADGDVGVARERLLAALETFEEVGAVGDEVDALDALADAERAAGDLAAAREWYDRALDRLDDVDDALGIRALPERFEARPADRNGGPTTGETPR